MINLDSLLSLLDVPKENAALFSLRQSNRAKRLIFKSSVRRGFEIVLPRVYNELWVRETVSKNKRAIEKRISEIKDARTGLRPTSVTLPVLERSWMVNYLDIYEKDSENLSETSTTLTVRENSEDVFSVATILQEWLHKKALDYLPEHLYGASIKINLPYNKVNIKRQRTLWGSCSVRRNINLNRNLLLMPYEVVDYVIYHELVHLKVLSHSSRFWEELLAIFPEYENSRKQLKHFEKFKIPEWALV